AALGGAIVEAGERDAVALLGLERGRSGHRVADGLRREAGGDLRGGQGRRSRRSLGQHRGYRCARDGRRGERRGDEHPGVHSVNLPRLAVGAKWLEARNGEPCSRVRRGNEKGYTRRGKLSIMSRSSESRPSDASPAIRGAQTERWSSSAACCIDATQPLL